MSGARLSDLQTMFLQDLHRTGAFAPHPNERRRANRLAARGLVVWERDTVQITDAGREAIGASQPCHACLEVLARGNETGLPHTCEKASR